MSDHNAQRTREFVALPTQHDREIFSYILALVPHWADAQDIQQATHIRLWDQFDEYDPAKDFGAWGRSIAHYQVLTHRKQTARRQTFSDHCLDLIAAESDRQAPDNEDRVEALHRCLKSLDDSGRWLLEQVYAHGQQVSAVAETLGKSAAATYKTLARLRQRLHRCIERRLKGQSTP